MLCLQVLHNMGLELQPPHCSVSIPVSEQGLLQVTLEDVRRLPRLDLQVRGCPADWLEYQSWPGQ